MSGLKLSSPVKVHAPDGEVFESAAVHNLVGITYRGYYTISDHNIVMPFILSDAGFAEDKIERTLTQVVGMFKDKKYVSDGTV